TPPTSGRSSPYAYDNYASSSSTLPIFNANTSPVSRFQSQRSAEELESQNDERVEGLSAKVKLLKDITMGIGNEVRESTVQLTQMNDAFAETSGILSGTFRRMNAMATRQGGRWACYMIFMVIVFWFFIVVWFLRR
ncbi:hypothetical protein BS47DRAFT_1287067, partial [Hydnum rufescens UP504]